MKIENFDLIETGDIVCIDIVPYEINGSFAGEMSTIYVEINGERVNWFPKLGPWKRSEAHARELAGL